MHSRFGSTLYNVIDEFFKSIIVSMAPSKKITAKLPIENMHTAFEERETEVVAVSERLGFKIDHHFISSTFFSNLLIAALANNQNSKKTSNKSWKKINYV